MGVENNLSERSGRGGGEESEEGTEKDQRERPAGARQRSDRDVKIFQIYNMPFYISSSVSVLLVT